MRRVNGNEKRGFVSNCFRVVVLSVSARACIARTEFSTSVDSRPTPLKSFDVRLIVEEKGTSRIFEIERYTLSGLPLRRLCATTRRSGEWLAMYSQEG